MPRALRRVRMHGNDFGGDPFGRAGGRVGPPQTCLELQPSSTRRLDACPLDGTEAANLLGDARQRERRVEIHGTEARGDPLDARAIVSDELALLAALRGAPERIERRPAQEAQARQQPERKDDPAAELTLARTALAIERAAR